MPRVTVPFFAGLNTPGYLYPVTGRSWDDLAKYRSRVEQWRLDVYLDAQFTGALPARTLTVLLDHVPPGGETTLACSAGFAGDGSPDADGFYVHALMGLMANGVVGISPGLSPSVNSYKPDDEISWNTGPFSPMLHFRGSILGPVSIGFLTWDVNVVDFDPDDPFWNANDSTLDGHAFITYSEDAAGSVSPGDRTFTLTPSRYWSHGGKYDILTGAEL